MTENKFPNLSGGMYRDCSAALTAGKQVAGVSMNDIMEILLSLGCEWQGGGSCKCLLSQLLDAGLLTGISSG